MMFSEGVVDFACDSGAIPIWVVVHCDPGRGWRLGIDVARGIVVWWGGTVGLGGVR